MKIGLGDKGKGVFDKPAIQKQDSRIVEKYKSTKVEKKTSTIVERKKQISLWLPEDLVLSLKIKAATQKKTISNFIKESLEEKLLK